MAEPRPGSHTPRVPCTGRLPGRVERSHKRSGCLSPAGAQTTIVGAAILRPSRFPAQRLGWWRRRDPAGAPKKLAELSRVGPAPAPLPAGRAAGLAVFEASGRARERSVSPRVTSRHPAPPASQSSGPSPSRRRTTTFRVRPFSRFEFPPAKQDRQNTRMVIAGLFAPILKKAERASTGANQSAEPLPSSELLPPLGQGRSICVGNHGDFFLLAQLGG
ncbi:hypothetical protein R6Z07F_020186 [Ovis aries]